ncbi:MAG: type IX secretion system sortase PorU [Bacteroidetes bacterium]|nr:type IX secretion system sortase PorU [Bacteroidota bacterium]
MFRCCSGPLLFIFLLFTGFLNAGPISSGTWVKMKLGKEGVYRVNANELSAAGFDLNSLDPRKLQLRGHQCGMLPESNNLHEGGMPEIPMIVIGENDGKFDAGDYILFYAGGRDKWVYNRALKHFIHSRNLYSDDAFLYLGIGTNNGLRIQTQTENTASPQQIITKYAYNVFHDSDMVNPLNMSRVWLGEKLGNEGLTRNFTFNLPSDVSDTSYVKVACAGGMKLVEGDLKITVNGTSSIYTFGKINEEYEVFKLGEREFWPISPQKQIQVNLELIRQNTQSSAWLNYIEINTTRNIDATQGPVVLRHYLYDSNTTTETRIPGSGNYVWNVTDEMIPAAMVLKSGSGFEYFISSKTGVNAAYVVFQPNKCLSPIFAGSVANADILGGDPAEFIIITHPDYMQASRDLKDFRTVNDNLSVKIVTPQEIYNEYNASQQDIVAIRDYLRDEYKKSLASGKSLKYVLLMGGASFDPKSRVANNTNFIPIYEMYSIIKSQTFCLDDFYAYLDSGLGNPLYGDNKMAFSVGRIPARNASEAHAVVAKLKRYESPNSLGPWRNDLSFICDDVDDPNYERSFLIETEKSTATISNLHPNLLINKVYADAYKQQSTGNTEEYPEVSASIDRFVNQGSLFMNYQGHGGEKGWAQEAILTVPMITAWKNYSQFPVLFTATCEFSRFDDPSIQSGGELALMNPNGGAIALMTTTRLVIVGGNAQINNDFWTGYGYPSPTEPIPTVGDIYKRLKNRPTPDSEDTKFALLGDPSMKLAIPEHKVVIDSINGIETNAFADTLKAFSIVKMKGHIDYRTGGVFSGFNGKLWVTILDKPQTKYTLDNDNTDSKMPYLDQTSVIYKGVVSVTNGSFFIIFTVPKDIAYNVNLGKISLYAHNGVTDASGALMVKIGSSLNNVETDVEGPAVKLFMNDTTFVSGGHVLPDAKFIARIYDVHGINATGAGIGRDMIAVLDPGTAEEREIIMNDYFSYDLNSYQKGTVNYNFSTLAEGRHTIRFKVWDIYNNSASASLDFVVVKENFVVNNSFVKPNPSEGPCYFVFEHNLAGKNLQAKVQIHDFTGKKIVSFDQHLEHANSIEDRLYWDGLTIGNSGIPHGMYIYVVELVSEDGRRAAFKGKLMRN